MAHYSDMRTKQDQRDVEDTLSLNRQSRVELDFKAFTSEERIDVCIMIQKEFREKTNVNAKRLTCLIFEVSAVFSMFIPLLFEHLYVSRVSKLNTRVKSPSMHFSIIVFFFTSMYIHQSLKASMYISYIDNPNKITNLLSLFLIPTKRRFMSTF